jgi:ATP-dependent DNA helicase RecG
LSDENPPPITVGELVALDVSVIAGVGAKKKDALEQFGIASVLDLLHTYPRRWIDRTNEARVCDLVEGVKASVLVRIDSVVSRRLTGGRLMVQARTRDETGRLTLTFFNNRWIEKKLVVGDEVVVFGKPEFFRGTLQMTSPEVDPVGSSVRPIVPVYRQKLGKSDSARITTRELAGWIANALKRCQRGLADPVPADVLERLGLPGRMEALRAIHLPDTFAERDAARRRLAFDEVFRIQVRLVARKRAMERSSLGVVHIADGPLVTSFAESLPYALTGAQRRVIGEITADMACPRPMHRLLQGDVGSGKTLVAMWAMLVAVQGGHQAALMAPTEVLAEQHATNIAELLAGLALATDAELFGSRPIRIRLLTGSLGAEARRTVLAGIASGEIDIVIGTHALIQESVGFASLGLVVIDEQHRFGVEQRAALRDRTAGARTPDVLSMTATPIPRSAALTVYGDLDVSVIDEKPPGRTPILTGWIDVSGEEAMWDEVRTGLVQGEQCYVVCPLIGDDERSPEDGFAPVPAEVDEPAAVARHLTAATAMRKRLAEGELSGFTVGLLHGRMSSADKAEVMEQFRAGGVQVLVATTVIEVGVDVANATMMVIVDADRFGIAQLHQLRGRVGRGSLASRCWLVTSGTEPGPRVEALVASTDGFELAEVDLALRGEGTLMDADQKGRSDLRLAVLQRDLDLIVAAREAASVILDDDPDLSGHPALADEIRHWFSEEDADYLTMG